MIVNKLEVKVPASEVDDKRLSFKNISGVAYNKVAVGNQFDCACIVNKGVLLLAPVLPSLSLIT